MFSKAFTMVDKEDMLKRSKEAKALMQKQIGNRIKELYQKELEKARMRMSMPTMDSNADQSFPQNHYEISDIT